jgi:uncharacterized protein (DUF1697 family)
VARHVALLRAINLPSHQKVAMPQLRELLSNLGMTEVESLLQTGNLVFESSGQSVSALESKLERGAKRQLDLGTDFFVRTARQWHSIVEGNPFAEVAGSDPGHLVVFVMKGTPTRKQVDALTHAIQGREVFRAAGRHAYIVYPDGIGRSRLTSALMEKKLGTVGTGRNWNTVRKIATRLETSH